MGCYKSDWSITFEQAVSVNLRGQEFCWKVSEKVCWSADAIFNTLGSNRKERERWNFLKGNNIQGGFLRLLSTKVLQSLSDPLRPMERNANPFCGSFQPHTLWSFHMKIGLTVLLKDWRCNHRIRPSMRVRWGEGTDIEIPSLPLAWGPSCWSALHCRPHTPKEALSLVGNLS